MQKKMLNRRKYTQSQKTGHEISFFWPLGGLDGLNSIEIRFYGSKMTRFNLIFQQSFFTFSMSAFEKIDISEGTSVKNWWFFKGFYEFQDFSHNKKETCNSFAVNFAIKMVRQKMSRQIFTSFSDCFDL